MPATGAKGHFLKLRLFLEGIEVPVVAAQIQVNINSPATAAIQIVPSDKVFEFKARTMVHLFFWDFTQEGQLPPQLPAGDQLNDPFVDAPELVNYRLLFSGEVIGVSGSKTPVSRSAVLQCADFSTYWDTTYQFMVTYSPNGNFMSVGGDAAAWAGGSSTFNDITEGHTSVMNTYLRRSPRTEGLQNVKGLMGGIISVLEVMGGVPNNWHGVNDFFTIAELKNKLLEQIVAEQNDSTALKLFDSKAFMDWLNRGMSSMGQLTTFRDMLKLLFKYIYYESVPNPSPMYIRGTGLKDTLVSSAGQQLSSTVQNLLGNMAVAINRRLGDPAPAFNDRALAKKMASDVQDLLDKGQIPDASIKKAGLAVRVLTKMTDFGFLTPLKGLSAPASVTARSEARFKKAQLTNNLAWQSAYSAITAVLTGKSQTPPASPFLSKKSKQKVAQSFSRDKLYTQIFRPDCFFAAPPRCNVLFPEHVTSFNYSRNYLQEVTRLRLSTGMMFGISGGLLGSFHFAPDTKEIREFAKQQGNAGIRALLPWEKFSGILPKFETVHEVNHIATQKQKQLTKNVKGSAASYAQRAANFNYFKYRFAARSCDISGRFNPFLVCGFPAAVIDRPFILDPAEAQRLLAGGLPPDAQGPTIPLAQQGDLKNDDPSEIIRKVARLAGAPTQYMGMVAGLSHNCDQGGGTTNVTLTHARSHRITEDDFLLTYAKQVTTDAQIEIKTTVLDAEELLKKGDWKRLKFLIDATPQNIPQQAEARIGMTEEEFALSLSGFNVASTGSPLEGRYGLPADFLVQAGLSPFSTVSRPTGAPPTGNVPALAAFVLLAPPQDQLQTSAAIVSGEIITPEGRQTLRGGVQEAQLQGSSKTILEPSPYAGGSKAIRPGSKGPLGGQVVQIECFTDTVLMMTGAELNKKTSRYATVAQLQRANPTDPLTDPDVSAEESSTVAFASQVGLSQAGIPQGITIPQVQQASRRRIGGTNFASNKAIFMWRKIAIYEKVKRKVAISKTIPIEEVLRPPWFSPLYSNFFIGENIYRPFFGTGSVVDEMLFQLTAPPSAGTTIRVGNEEVDITGPQGGGTVQASAVVNTSAQNVRSILSKIDAAGGDTKKIAQILDDNRTQLIGDTPDVESAIDTLAYIYGEVRRLGRDVHRFVNEYTYRPIATLKDIFGSDDLEYKLGPDGKSLEVLSGTPGFHSTAVLRPPNNVNLLGLADDPDLALPRLSPRGAVGTLSKTLDPREQRREQVEEYVKDLQSWFGKLGIGLLG